MANTYVDDGTKHHESVLAAINIAALYRETTRRFSDHLLFLEDIFFFDDRRHEDLFLLSVKLLQPALPFSELEQESAQNRFVRLVKSFEEASEHLLAEFQEESEAVRALYQGLMAAEQRRWAEADASRQDELHALSQVCRREVAATVARLKADTAQTATELDAIGSLQVALESKSAEVESLRTSLNGLLASHEIERKRWLSEIAREREASRELLQSDRSQFTAQLQNQIRTAEVDRLAHHNELLERDKRFAHQLEQLRKRLVEQQDENDKLRSKMDELGVEHSRELRLEAEERTRLTRMITDLEISYETLRRSLQEVEADAKLNQLDAEHLTETRKLLEIQSFKKRLADTTRLLSSSSITSNSGAPPTTAPTPRTPRALTSVLDVSPSHQFGRGSPSPSALATSKMSVADFAAAAPPPYREPSVSMLQSLLGPPSARDRSRSPGTSRTASTATLRSPSDSFLRLARQSRQSVGQQ